MTMTNVKKFLEFVGTACVVRMLIGFAMNWNENIEVMRSLKGIHVSDLVVMTGVVATLELLDYNEEGRLLKEGFSPAVVAFIIHCALVYYLC